MKAIVLSSIFLISFFLSFGQTNYSTSSKKAIKLYEEAQLLIRQRKITDAVEVLKESVAKDNNFLEAHLKLAFSYELLRNIEGQQYHLEQIIRIDPNSSRYKNVYYSLGKVYFNQGKYEQSHEMLSKLVRLGIDNPRIKSDVEGLNENIQFAVESIKKPLDIHPQALSEILNAFPLQYFPVLTADENTIIYTAREGISFHDDENIVISNKDEDGNWQQPISISPNINSQFNEGTCTISADGRTLIFTNCEGRQSYGSCDLYISYRNGDEWSVPKNLGKNINSRSWDSQPALSADGRKLFFVSNRGGGKGKRDIWMSQKDDENSWQKAVNLGNVINSTEDEVSPFIHVNGTTLFFASQGFPGFGGYDIYKSEKSVSGWSQPENLGYPINTHEDQVSMFVSTNGKNGYYSFERKGQGKQNQSLLYGFEFPANSILENASIYLTGNVYDNDTKKPLHATLELYDLGSDKPTAIFTSDPVTGKYFSILNENKKIVLYIDREGYLFESKLYELSVENSNSINRDIYLKPIKKGNSTRLNNIFFEVNSALLTTESITELNKLVHFLTLNPTTKITICGHTDNQGTTAYNMILSEDRARAVYDFLIKRDISPSKLTFIGYGESKPIVENVDKDSMRANRRIEFVISN